MYQRLVQHERALRLRNTLSETPIIYNDIIQYGIDNFEFLILEIFESGTIKYEDLYQLEKEYVIKYDAIYPNGYNTYYPMPTNNKKIGQYIVCHTAEEAKAKRKEYNKNFATISFNLSCSDVEKLDKLALSLHKSRNAFITGLVEQLINENSEKGGE